MVSGERTLDCHVRVGVKVLGAAENEAGRNETEAKLINRCADWYFNNVF